MTGSRILIASGGPTYAHDHRLAAEAIADILRVAHTVVGETSHPREIPDAIARTTPDVIVSHMLWWRMLAERYDDLRSTWAYESSIEVRSALSDFVHGGGALVALHTSTICFDDWSGWGELLGAQWNWDRSFHPALGPVSVRLASAASAGASRHGSEGSEGSEIVAGLADYDTVDEVYMHLDLQDDIEPLAFARLADAPFTDEHPILWGRRVGRGAVAQFGLGHDVASLHNPTTAELVRRCVAWTVRSSRASSGH